MPNDGAPSTRALALVGTSFSYALIATLMKKGLLTKDEANEFFEAVLTNLEAPQAPIDPAMKEARVLVDGMAQIAATGKLP